MRVLLCVHHALDPDLGAPGATLALGAALEVKGCEVEYFSFDRAYGGSGDDRVGHQLRFPWRVAAFLLRRGREFDVVDASTGDAWVWAGAGRPRARGTALVTRAHGLEHVADEWARRAASVWGPPLSWKYPLYHGGWRLREVRRSLRLSDHCVLLNAHDRDYARDRLGVSEERLSVVPNGVAERFHSAPSPRRPAGGALRLAFVGAWSDRKGRRELVEAAELLRARGVEFSLRLLGTGDEAAVLRDVPEPLRPRVSVTPSFPNEALVGLLAGEEVLLFPSHFEGASVALIEAMACGLAPVATSVGSAPEVLADRSTGVLVEPGDPAAIAAAVERLASDRERLLDMRTRAQEVARGYRWDDVAAKTLDVYGLAATARSTASRKRRPTVGQV